MPSAAYMREYYARAERFRAIPAKRLVRMIANYYPGQCIAFKIHTIRIGDRTIECIRSDLGERMRL